MKWYKTFAAILSFFAFCGCAVQEAPQYYYQSMPEQSTVQSEVEKMASASIDGLEHKVEVAPEPDFVQAPEEHLLVTTMAYTNHMDTSDGMNLVLYDYGIATGELNELYNAPYYGLYPANAVDFENQILYLADGHPEDGYDNLIQYDMQTGESKQLTYGRFRFDALILVQGQLYANAAREGATVCQPAVFDFAKGDFTYRNPEDDDTWHYSFSYHADLQQFLIMTCSDAEMRTYHVAAETHIRPKTVSILNTDLQTCTPVYFTDQFEIRLTRQLDDNHILMTTDPFMGGGPRTLQQLTIDTQEVQPYEIPDVWTTYLFEPTVDGSKLFFIGKRSEDTDWKVYEYDIGTQNVTPLPLPDTVQTIPDIQYVLQ